MPARPAAPAAVVALPSFRAVGDWDGLFASTPLYDIELDAAGGMILIRTRGFWTVDEVDDYYAVLGELVTASRIRFGRVRLLADVTQAPIQARDVAERFTVGNAIFTEPGDKLALIVNSSLQKIQIRRQLAGDRSQVFVSQSAALMWINAYP